MKLAELKGLIPEEVGEYLANRAADVPPGRAIVEVGSYMGKSTCYLASGARDGVEVYAVDPWDLPGNETGRFGFAEESTRKAFDRQIMEADLEHKITPIQGFSREVAFDWDRELIGLLFIDGNHDADAVYEDAIEWSAHLAMGAVVVLDDLDTTRNPGVRIAAEKMRPSFGDFTIEAGRLAVFRL